MHPMTIKECLVESNKSHFIGRIRKYPCRMSFVRMQSGRISVRRLRRRLRPVRLPPGHPGPDLRPVQAGVLRILQQGMPE